MLNDREFHYRMPRIIMGLFAAMAPLCFGIAAVYAVTTRTTSAIAGAEPEWHKSAMAIGIVLAGLGAIGVCAGLYLWERNGMLSITGVGATFRDWRNREKLILWADATELISVHSIYVSWRSNCGRIDLTCPEGTFRAVYGIEGADEAVALIRSRAGFTEQEVHWWGSRFTRPTEEAPTSC